MSAQVIKFPSIVAGGSPKPTLPTCRCPRHELDALASRIRERLASTDGEILVARDHLAAVLEDVTATTGRLLPARGLVTR